jgi:hypothetical protein
MSDDSSYVHINLLGHASKKETNTEKITNVERLLSKNGWLQETLGLRHYFGLIAEALTTVSFYVRGISFLLLNKSLIFLANIW